MDKEILLLGTFQSRIYQILNSFYNKDFDIEKDQVIMMQAAVLLKTAVELYSTQFPSDEPIERILESAKEQRESLITKNLVLANVCPACRYEYIDETQLCPECGAVRPMIAEDVE